MPAAEETALFDGKHTFDELYEHRVLLFLALMKTMPERAWISEKHDSGWEWSGFFIGGMRLETGDITYHIPNRLWNMGKATGARVLKKAPFWDGHSSDDVLKRLANWVERTAAS